jgi:hypothetical protein
VFMNFPLKPQLAVDYPNVAARIHYLQDFYGFLEERELEGRQGRVFKEFEALFIVDEAQQIWNSRRAMTNLQIESRDYIFTCLEENTVLLTRNGPRSVKDVRAGDEVMSTFGFQIVEAVNQKTVNGLLRIELEDGTVIRCTPEHRFPCRKGRNFVSFNDHEANLMSKKHLPTVLFKQLDGLKPLPRNDYAALLGVIAAEGSIRKYSLAITIDEREQDLANFIIRTLIKYYSDAKLNVRIKQNSHGMAIEISKMDIAQDIAKRLNSFYAQPQSDVDVASWLSGFMEGNGTVNKIMMQFTQSDVHANIRETAKKFLTQLAIKFSTTRVLPKPAGTYRGHIVKRGPTEIVSISNKAAMRRFNILVGFISQRKNDKLRAVLFKQRKRGGFMKQHSFLADVTVKSVSREIGEFNVYDVELNGDYPYFFANGILTHNSRKLGLELHMATQLASNLDKSAKLLVQLWVVCTKYLDAQGQAYFMFERYSPETGNLPPTYLLPSVAAQFYPYYETTGPTSVGPMMPMDLEGGEEESSRPVSVKAFNNWKTHTSEGMKNLKQELVSLRRENRQITKDVQRQLRRDEGNQKVLIRLMKQATKRIPKGKRGGKKHGKTKKQVRR